MAKFFENKIFQGAQRLGSNLIERVRKANANRREVRVETEEGEVIELARKLKEGILDPASEPRESSSGQSDAVFQENLYGQINGIRTRMNQDGISFRELAERIQEQDGKAGEGDSSLAERINDFDFRYYRVAQKYIGRPRYYVVASLGASLTEMGLTQENKGLAANPKVEIIKLVNELINIEDDRESVGEGSKQARRYNTLKREIINKIDQIEIDSNNEAAQKAKDKIKERLNGIEGIGDLRDSYNQMVDNFPGLREEKKNILGEIAKLVYQKSTASEGEPGSPGSSLPEGEEEETGTQGAVVGEKVDAGEAVMEDLAPGEIAETVAEDIQNKPGSRIQALIIEIGLDGILGKFKNKIRWEKLRTEEKEFRKMTDKVDLDKKFLERLLKISQNVSEYGTSLTKILGIDKRAETQVDRATETEDKMTKKEILMKLVREGKEITEETSRNIFNFLLEHSPKVTKNLDDILRQAFKGQPDQIDKIKEAIENLKTDGISPENIRAILNSTFDLLNAEEGTEGLGGHTGRFMRFMRGKLEDIKGSMGKFLKDTFITEDDIWRPRSMFSSMDDDFGRPETVEDAARNADGQIDVNRTFFAKEEDKFKLEDIYNDPMKRRMAVIVLNQAGKPEAARQLTREGGSLESSGDRDFLRDNRDQIKRYVYFEKKLDKIFDGKFLEKLSIINAEGESDTEEESSISVLKDILDDYFQDKSKLGKLTGKEEILAAAMRNEDTFERFNQAVDSYLRIEAEIEVEEQRIEKEIEYFVRNIMGVRSQDKEAAKPFRKKLEDILEISEKNLTQERLDTRDSLIDQLIRDNFGGWWKRNIFLSTSNVQNSEKARITKEGLKKMLEIRRRIQKLENDNPERVNRREQTAKDLGDMIFGVNQSEEWLNRATQIASNPGETDFSNIRTMDLQAADEYLSGEKIEELKEEFIERFNQEFPDENRERINQINDGFPNAPIINLNRIDYAKLILRRSRSDNWDGFQINFNDQRGDTYWPRDDQRRYKKQRERFLNDKIKQQTGGGIVYELLVKPKAEKELDAAVLAQARAA
jgi:hypothetical protein